MPLFGWPKLLTILALGAWMGPVQGAEQPPTPGRIAGNLFRLGSAEGSVFLIVTPAGHILINSGSSPRSETATETPAIIRAQMEQLQFRFEDIELLLTSHAHADHVGGHAEIKRLTGAKVLVMRGDEQAVRTGTSVEYGLRMRWAQPCEVDEVIDDGHRIELGGSTLVAHRTGGHTRGATTWALRVIEAGQALNIALLDSAMYYPGRGLFDDAYPHRLQDFVGSLRKLRSLPMDIALDPHGRYLRGTEEIEPFLATKQNELLAELQAQFAIHVDPEARRRANAEAEREFRASFDDPNLKRLFPELELIEP